MTVTDTPGDFSSPSEKAADKLGAEIGAPLVGLHTLDGLAPIDNLTAVNLGNDVSQGVVALPDKLRPNNNEPLDSLKLVGGKSGSAGREGAALQLGGSISNSVGRLLRLDEKGTRNLIKEVANTLGGVQPLFGLLSYDSRKSQ